VLAEKDLAHHCKTEDSITHYQWIKIDRSKIGSNIYTFGVRFSRCSSEYKLIFEVKEEKAILIKQYVI